MQSGHEYVIRPLGEAPFNSLFEMRSHEHKHDDSAD